MTYTSPPPPTNKKRPVEEGKCGNLDKISHALGVKSLRNLNKVVVMVFGVQR